MAELGLKTTMNQTIQNAYKSCCRLLLHTERANKVVIMGVKQGTL
jgi:hypothetical protein